MKVKFMALLVLLTISIFATSVSVASQDEVGSDEEVKTIEYSRFNVKRSALDDLIDPVTSVKKSVNKKISSLAVENRQTIISPMAETVKNFTFAIDATGQADGSITEFVLKGTASDDFWDGETVIFIREGYANKSYVTGSNGEILINDITYTAADIGRFNYSIYFEGSPSTVPGFPPTRPAKEVANGTITVTASVQIDTPNRLPDTDLISPNTAYSYEFTLSFLDGTTFDPNTYSVQDEFNAPVTPGTVQAIFNETYLNDQDQPDSQISLSSKINDTTVSFVGGKASISSDSGAQVIRTKISLNFTLIGIDPAILDYITFVNLQSITSPIYTVKVDYVFNSRYYIQSKEITTVNQADETFYRNGTDLVINGSLVNAVVDQTLLENIEVGVSINYQPITGGATQQIAVTKTGVGGFFEYKLNLNNTYFEFVESSLTVSVLLDPNNLATQLQDMTTADKQSSRTISFRADMSNMTVSTIVSTDTLFLSENSQFTFKGKISYDNNASRNVQGQAVMISIVGGSSFENLTVTTLTNGSFIATVTSSLLSSLDQNVGQFSIYAWIDDIIGANQRYYNPLNLSSVPQLFNISLGLNLTVTTNIFGNTFNGSTPWDILNNTMYNIYSNVNANYSMIFKDSVGRAPLGFILVIRERVYDTSSNVFSETTFTFQIVNVSKNGYSFLLTSFSGVLADVAGSGSSNPFNFAGSTFEYQFSVQDSSGVAVNSAGVGKETFVLYGPDNVAPQLNTGDIQATDPQDQAVDIVVGVNITTATKFDNIRNVTIYYRYSDNNLISDPQDAVFSSGYTVALMTYNSSSGYFEFTITFRNSDDHGRWVEFYFVVYDLAGHGLDVNGNTVDASTYSYPDPNFSLFTNYSSQAQMVKLGDSTPPTLNGGQISSTDSFGQNVYICEEGNCQALENFDGEIALGANVTIEVRGITDPNGIQNVTLFYTYSYYNPENDSFYGQTNVTVLMTFDFVTGYYIYDFDSALFDYNFQLDFEVTVYDTIGNSDTSGTAGSKFGQGNTIITVDDLVDPVIEGVEDTFVDNNVDPKAPREGVTQTPPSYQFYSNETLSVSINVTDYGGLGIRNITIFWTYTNASGIVETGNFTRNYDLGTQQALFIFNFTGYNTNMTITYKFVIVDWGDNVLNQDGAYAFTAVEPPQPDLIVTTIISTGDDGNTTAIVTVISDTSSTVVEDTGGNNSLIILMAFIGVFLAFVVANRYQSILEWYQARGREKLVRSSMESRIDLIRKYGTEGEYLKAVLEIWKATQTLGAEGLQAPQRYNQTVRDYIDILERVSSIERDMLETLAFTFEKAKYGQEQITADDYKDALEALNVAIDTVIALGVRSAVDDEDDWSELDFDEEE